MKSAYQEQHSHQLNAILAALPKDADARLHRFVRQFYARAPLDDLEHYGPAHAVALAMSAYEFMRDRPPGKPKIRVFTPQKHEHGYDSKNTAIEIINDDMPFLVDSLSTELIRHGFTVRETIHPIIHVRRGKSGALEAIIDSEKKSAESLIHFEISPLPEDLTAAQLAADLEWVLGYIKAAVEDWKPIVAKVAAYARTLSKAKSGFGRAASGEVKAFLRWLADRNFLFLGYGEYGAPGKSKAALTKLGILKITDDTADAELERFLAAPQFIEITKSNRRSPLHRPVPMDTISLKRFDARGNVIGEARFFGLFTSNVYYQSAERIPLLRRKIAEVLKRADLDPASHDGKALKSILEFLPRDEVFQMSDDDLFDTGMGVLALEAKPGVRVFVRRDAFERFISAMVFVPRERFSTSLRHQIQTIIEKAFNATSSSFSTQITEAPLARLHVILKTTPGDIPSVDMKKIEQDIARRAYLWSESLFDALAAKHGERKAGKLQRIYGSAFPQNYINRYDSAQAVYDIGKIEEAIAAQGLALELFSIKNETGVLHLKTYNPSEEIALSDILPMLEKAGFRVIDEHPFLIAAEGAPSVWIRDFKLQATAEGLPLETVKPLLENILLKVWRRDMENDRFNALALRAGLDERQITVLRAYAGYLRQIGFTYAQAAIEQAMGQQPRIAALIVSLFEKRFFPHEKDRDTGQQALQEAIEKSLADVSGVAEDRILRRYVDLVLATIRTNYFQTTDGGAKPALSFKMNSRKVPELPPPVPYAEIFVYSPRVEGIHLRGGKVARGGLRWSDRHDDYRTEVLGLMKAQMVKNSVIVPVGSKGGFVLKQPPSGSREALMEEGVACYKTYLRALLDLTDNIKNGIVTPPPQLVRHDGDDPYLVVAADKGTATFSDIANSVSAEYGFWLGDAFASGGSVGYDHKKMGITARGGWVSVTRHFREMGVDIAAQNFTCVGIGDMAGDVFGNGVLLSNRIALVAAFNHIHIFLDPAPDPQASFEERKRLFHWPRSSWKDYDVRCISKGGGVFERGAKSIALSKEAQEALGIRRDRLTPDELIRAILLAPVDLLWNGGIGTYVKAEDESNEQVGDRANNAVRVNGKQLRCKIVGEGGNLGFTQKGRVEYARAGGRINTDAIDNSAGVDCSDHEVNIKIAFSREMAEGKLTLEARDRQLAAMTDEVAHLVLTDNVLQTQALSIAEKQGTRLLDSQGRLMRALEKQGLLDRPIEFLPDDKHLAELKAGRQGLTRPELAVLLAYSKMELCRSLLESSLPDEPYFAADLIRYFPAAMRDGFASAISQHHLKREIIATVVTNSLINRAGMTFVFDIAEDLGVGPRDITAAYALARDAFDLRTLWDALEAAESSVAAQTLADMQRLTGEFLEQVTVWLLRNLPLPIDIDKASRELLPAAGNIEQYRNSWHSEETRQSQETLLAKLKEQQVPEALAHRIAGLELLSSAFNIVTVAREVNLPIGDVGKAYFSLGARLHFGWLRSCADKIVAGSYWDRLAVQSIIADLYDEQRRLTAIAIRHPETGVSGWCEAHLGMLKRYEQLTSGMKAGNPVDTAMLMVVLRHIRSLGGNQHA
ncbi:MAG: NAD-glutamate dehydrogenase [Pseudomonadota bacterium]|nr:NAD-glutamate dehydrogenase [Pseudomonadota bacterium]MDE3036850.1 NAD-glutamate dehydrogenase [Pseudomonadota bacterium]